MVISIPQPDGQIPHNPFFIIFSPISLPLLEKSPLIELNSVIYNRLLLKRLYVLAGFPLKKD